MNFTLICEFWEKLLACGKLFIVFVGSIDLEQPASLFSVPIPRHKSHLSHVNIFLRHYGGQLKTAVEQEVGEKIGFKR